MQRPDRQGARGHRIEHAGTPPRAVHVVQVDDVGGERVEQVGERPFDQRSVQVPAKRLGPPAHEAVQRAQRSGRWKRHGVPRMLARAWPRRHPVHVVAPRDERRREAAGSDAGAASALDV